MKTMTIVARQHLVLVQKYSDSGTTCPNRTIENAPRDTAAELDATVTIVRDMRHLTQEGYVIEAGELTRLIRDYAYNDRSCEQIAEVIGKGIVENFGSNIREEGVLSIKVDLQNGPISMVYDETFEPLTDTERADIAKRKADEEAAAKAKAAKAGETYKPAKKPYNLAGCY